MPGLIGWIRTPDAAPSPPAPTPLLERPGVTLRADPRAGAPAVPVADVATSGNRALALHGHAHDPAAGRRLDAAALLALWDAEGERVVERLEGAFHCVVADRAAGRVTLVNDRLGVLPLYWRASARDFAFAPRLAALPGLARPWTPDPAGVVTFLANGYCLGTRTLVDGVSQLAPAEIITIDTATLAVTRRRYWDLAYAPDPAASPRSLARDLYERIIEALLLLTPVGSARCGLLLSGGWDCRGLLGGALALDRPPAAVITNGVSDRLRGTDTALAKRLAGALGLEYRFCRRDPALGAQLALDGIARCDLRADTCPEVFGQHRVPPAVFAGLDSVLKGDEIWGWQDEARNRDQAVGNVMPNRLSPRLLEVLAPDLRARAEELWRAEIEAVLAGCAANDWNDTKDYLYLKGRVCRYIFGLGGSDEEHVQVIRPYLTKGVLDVVQRLPGRLRVQKNLFLEMLARHEPRLFAYGRNHGSHIADYYFHMAPFVRERATASLDAGHDLGGLLDRAAARRLLAAFAPPEAPPAPEPGGLDRLRNRALDRWSHRWYRTGFARDRAARQTRLWSASDAAVTFRVWLLAELFAGGA
ncbi:MAG: hypothetical protein ACYDIE_02930 [Candidatus Krumholzibacteriia bacterium]